ncbi:hypothetical protein V9T40_014815 [Parthenolecanium corni]|uniref:Uncharacterized protein n=1 Tax=Parthenolecanium corni TaxID=536013 RepID=A0AAN9T6N8_9HEMI
MEPRYPQRTRNRDLEIAEDASNDNENEEDASVGEDGDKDREDEEDDTDEDDDDDDDDDEEDDDEEDVEQLPYPGFRPIALRYLDQRSRSGFEILPDNKYLGIDLVSSCAYHNLKSETSLAVRACQD